MTSEQRHKRITTWPGLVLSSLSVLIWTASFFLELKRPVEDYILGIAFLLGIVLIIAPQRITDFFFNLISKKKL